jgi:DNA ligase (NAD+)
VRADSPSLLVGSAPSGHLAKVAHALPMLSLDNAFSDEEVTEFVDRVRRFLRLDAEEPVVITAEPKIDGLSCSLRYEGRRWCRRRRAGTAGGRGCHANVRLRQRYPADFAGDAPDLFEIRGEVYMAKADFAALNARLLAEARGPMSPRRASSPIRAMPPPVRCARRMRMSPRPGRCASSPMAGARPRGLPAETQTGVMDAIEAGASACHDSA